MMDLMACPHCGESQDQSDICEWHNLTHGDSVDTECQSCEKPIRVNGNMYYEVVEIEDWKLEVEPIRKMSDVKRMYNYLLEHSTPREAECWIIGCNLALRAGDLLQLRFDQIAETHVSIVEQKTGKKKRFPVTQVVRDAVDRLKNYYASKGFEATYLFQSTSNRAFHLCQPICIQWLGQALKDASRGLELGYNVNTHSMRKTWGYHAYERGEDIHYLQALFNHATSKVTLRYIGVTKTALEKMYYTNALEIA